MPRRVRTGPVTVWDAMRVLNRKGLTLKHKGRSIQADEGLWLVGRRYGRFFAITASFASLVALQAWIEAL